MNKILITLFTTSILLFSFIFTLCFANDDLNQKNKINNYKKKLINTTGICEEYLNKSSVDLFLIVITNQKNKN